MLVVVKKKTGWKTSNISFKTFTTAVKKTKKVNYILLPKKKNYLVSLQLEFH